MIPSEKDLQKKKEMLDGFKKSLDQNGRSKESDMIRMVRGAIRQSWMKSPTKLAYLYSKIEPDFNPDTRTKWQVRCECCGGMFKMSDIEIDHKHGNHPLNTVEDFKNYFEKILMVGYDDLQALCVECHEIKTLQERLDVSFEEAKAHKFAISLQKKKDADKHWLIERGFVPAKKKEDRRTQIVNAIVS